MTGPADSPPREPLDMLPPDELERRARDSIERMFGEARAARQSAKALLNPVALIRQHPKFALAAGGVLLAVLWRVVRGRKLNVNVAPAEPETVGRTLGKSVMLHAARAAGKALPAALIWGLARTGWARHLRHKTAAEHEA